MPLLTDPEFREQLAPFLPAGDELSQNPTELATTLRSPQFQQVSVVQFAKYKIVLFLSQAYCFSMGIHSADTLCTVFVPVLSELFRPQTSKNECLVVSDSMSLT